MSKKFLIGQLACFGDCLYATTLAKQIKHDYPDSRVTWAVSARYKSILELNPHIDEIWEFPLSTGNVVVEGWQSFEKQAESAKTQGIFDEIFYTQVHDRNLESFYSTLRNTTLGVYEKPITVDLSPVVRLSETETEKVGRFAEINKLRDYKNVILFECAPGSGQSKVSLEMALEVAGTLTSSRKDVCFVLSSPQKLELQHSQIIDASSLTYRENAELTHHCTHLIGCSSGITWLSTSDWAKKLPMLQLLNSDSPVFAGVHYDFELNGLDYSQIIEMTEYNQKTVIECVESILEAGIEKTKVKFHQSYKPDYHNLKTTVQRLLWKKTNYGKIAAYIKNFVRKNAEAHNKIDSRYWYLFVYAYFYTTVKTPQSGFFYNMRSFGKFILCRK